MIIRRNKIGYLYVVSNIELENMYKIGITQQPIKTRLLQQKSEMKLKEFFTVEYLVQLDNYKEVEKALHNHFKDRQVNWNTKFSGYTEFFNVEDVNEIIAAIHKYADIEEIKTLTILKDSEEYEDLYNKYKMLEKYTKEKVKELEELKELYPF